MKNEEAKTNLEKLLLLYDDDDAGIIDFSIIRESIKVAIEALKKQDVPDTNVGDTISRQAAIDAIECIVDHHCITPYQTMRAAIDHAKRIMSGLPSAQPERKTGKTGKWLIRKFGADAICSACGMSFRDVYDLENSDEYCRHCGSKMDGLILENTR